MEAKSIVIGDNNTMKKILMYLEIESLPFAMATCSNWLRIARYYYYCYYCFSNFFI